MSVKLMTAAFGTELPTTQKFVFVALCDNASDEGDCYPSISTLCKKTSLSERAVQGAIKRLVAMGYMSATMRKGQSTIYRISPVSEWPDLSVTPAPDAPPQEMRPAPRAPHPRTTCTPPPQEMRGTPAPRAPITIIEPSYNHQGTVIECACEPDKPKSKRKTRLPENWFLPKDWGDWAMDQGLTETEIRAEAECFADHWHSKGETRADWLATWRNWIRRRKTFDRRPTQTTSKKSIYEQNREAGARARKLIFGDAA